MECEQADTEANDQAHEPADELEYGEANEKADDLAYQQEYDTAYKATQTAPWRLVTQLLVLPRQAVKRLFDVVSNLQRVPEPVVPALAVVPAPSEQLPQEPAELASPSEAERCLQEQLAIINQACDKIAKMMPEAAQRFKKGYPFQAKTVHMVQRSWFHISDMQSALSGRTALHRPKSWEGMRKQVMSACPDGE